MVIAAAYCYKLGFLLTISEIFGLIVATTVALLVVRPVAMLVGSLPETISSIIVAIALIASWVIVQWLIFKLLRSLLDQTPPNVQASKINKISGGVIGALWALGLSASILFISLSLPINHRLKAMIREIPLVHSLVLEVGARQDDIKALISQNILQPMGLVKIQSQQDDRIVQLSFKTNDSRPAPALESKMIELVNNERKKANLNTLSADSGLTLAARTHSIDMLAGGYFAHKDLAGHDPFWRISKAHVDFLAAGENLALAPNLELGHTNLMNSPEHRSNILSKDYGRVGIGVLDAGQYGLMITQEFAD